LQRFTTEGLEGVAISVAPRLSRRSFWSLPEILTSVTVPDVELVRDDREPHGVSAVQKLTVFDRVKTEVHRDVWRPTSVPARPVPHLRLRQ
jgi:hypothetical protein